jgi:primary-amine oxidase
MNGSLSRCLAASLLTCSLGAAAAAPQLSPWDALTADEIRTAAAAVRREYQGPLIFNELKLARPDKAAALAWKPEQSPARRAEVVFMRDGRAYEGTVDLAQASADITALPDDVQPMLSVDGEILPAMAIAGEHPGVVAALARRGLEPEDVLCGPMTVGRYPGDEGDTRRLAKLLCLKTTDKARHVFSQPVEGLIPVLDLESRKIVEVIDLYADDPPPVPALGHDFDEASIPPRDTLNAIRQTQSSKPNYQRSGSRVRWQNWDFRFSYDPRQGVILNDVAYQDGKRRRSVLYEIAMSEMFVPYQDPTPAWYFRTYFDMGEYGFGNSGTALAGADCPAYAERIDVTLHDAGGEPFQAPARICLFERDPARPVWRHTSTFIDAHESRPATQLVVRMAATVGNYDYFQDFVFAQDGRFRVELISTGIDAVKGVTAAARDQAKPGELDYGTLIAPQLLGVNHDHFFSYRIDLDVDGTANDFARLRLVPQQADDSPRAGYWRVEPEAVTSEQPARTRLSPDRPAALVFRNAAARNAMGEPASFQIIHQSITRPLVDPEDPAYQRGAFTAYDLWVTRYAADERFASGKHINQGAGGMGLPAWTSADRNLENTDLVAWATLGFHHVPMAEDWPVMPAKVDALELKPRNFFDRNPAIDVPTTMR